MHIEETMNFLEYYNKYKNDYKDLFAKFKLIFGPGKSIEKDLWEIAHLYRVLICKKKSKGRTIQEFNLKERQNSIIKEVKSQHGNNRHHSNNQRFSNNRDNRDNRDYNRRDNSDYGNNHSRSRDNK